MKKIVILFIGILLISCNEGKKEKSKKTTTELTETTDNFDWLLGEWKRSNEEVGKETFSNWDKKSDTEYTGLSYTTQKGDTIYEQYFKFFKSKSDWVFQIMLKGETTPSSFKMTSHSSKQFICENKEEDYPNKEEDSPNKIKYWTDNGKLYATISGEKIKLDFEYVLINK